MTRNRFAPLNSACWLLFLSLTGTPAALSASRPAGDETSEIEMLEARMSRLEAQNQVIMEELTALRARSTSDTNADSQGSRPSEILIGPGPVSGSTPAPEPTENPPSAIATEKNHSRLSFYGFARLDAIIDDSRPDSFQSATFIQSESPGLDNHSNFTLHPRLSRIGMNFQGPRLDSLGGAAVSALIETDFQNGGRESRAIPRYRQAYMKLSWENSSLLLGQTWDIISPLYPSVNADTLMWNAGNMGDRRPQVRYTFEPKNGFSLRAGVALTGAVDAQDLDQDGVRDGEASTLPNLQTRIGYRSPQGRINAGLSAHYAREQAGLAGNHRDFGGNSLGLDYEIKFNPQLNLKGELWRGRNLSDFRGGIGQGVNTLSGQEIESRGGWIELGLLPRPAYAFSLGFTTDDPRNGQVAAGGRTENRAWYITNRFRLAPPFSVGLDYLYWKTNFKGIQRGTDNRFNLYFVYDF